MRDRDSASSLMYTNFQICIRYTNADLKISLLAFVHMKAIP